VHLQGAEKLRVRARRSQTIFSLNRQFDHSGFVSHPVDRSHVFMLTSNQRGTIKDYVDLLERASPVFGILFISAIKSQIKVSL